MTIDLVPLSQFSERHAKGWRMVAGYDLKAGDYAVTMQSPGHNLVESNKSKACASRNATRGLQRMFPSATTAAREKAL